MKELLRKVSAAFMLLFVSCYLQAGVITGSTEVDLRSAESFIDMFDQSTLNVYAGGDIAFLDLFDQSTANVFGGEVSWIHSYDRATTNISGGDISWLKAYDQSVMNISYIEDLSWLLVSDDSVINIYGSDFSYSRGHLSGTWFNGQAFSFWALEENRNYPAGNVLPDNIVLHAVAVSEPSSLAILFFGLAMLLTRGKSKQGSH